MSNFHDKLKKKTTENFIENINISSVIQSQIHILDLSYEINNDFLLDKIFKFKNLYPKSMLDYNKDRTFVRSWHSDYKTHLMTDILNPLIELQKKKFKKIYSSLECQISDIWINIYQKNNYAVRHHHGLFQFSTIYFPKVESNATPAIFDNNFGKDKKEIKIVPKTGMLLCFPSFIYHAVPPVTEESRISIAANFDVKNCESKRDPFSFQD